jgi:hypothetical protein
MSPVDLDELREGVAAAAAAAGISGLRLEGSDVDLDVPIPLICKVDATCWFEVEGVDGGPVGHLSIALWGEAYDRLYGVSLRGRVGDERFVMLEVPSDEPELLRPRWTEAHERFCGLLGRVLDASELLDTLGFGLPAGLQEEWDWRARSALPEMIEPDSP